MSEISLFQFVWPVPKAGYQWESVRPPKARRKQRWLVESPAETDPPAVAPTHPVEEAPALFLEFAHLETSEQAVLSFANAHGLLGLGTEREVPGRGLFLAEPAQAWFALIKEMKFGVRLQHAADQGNFTAIKELLSERPIYPVTFREMRSTAGTWIPLPHRGSGDRKARPDDLPTDLREAIFEAKLGLAQIANANLEKAGKPAVLFRPQETRLDVQIVPITLLGCMWLQFALSLDGSRKFSQCKHCNGWYAIDPRIGKRRHREFCAERCRSAHYREKKEKALQLSIKGMKPAAIAAALDSDPKTVRGWITRAKEKSK